MWGHRAALQFNPYVTTSAILRTFRLTVFDQQCETLAMLQQAAPTISSLGSIYRMTTCHARSAYPYLLTQIKSITTIWRTT